MTHSLYGKQLFPKADRKQDTVMKKGGAILLFKDSLPLQERFNACLNLDTAASDFELSSPFLVIIIS